MDTYGRVIDEVDAMTLVTLDAIMQARGGAPPERPGMTVRGGDIDHLVQTSSGVGYVIGGETRRADDLRLVRAGDMDGPCPSRGSGGAGGLEQQDGSAIVIPGIALT